MTDPKANATQRRLRRQRRAERVEVDGRLHAPLPAERHGTQSTFNNWGCQCEPCTEANRVRQRADRALHQRLDQAHRQRLAARGRR